MVASPYPAGMAPLTPSSPPTGVTPVPPGYRFIINVIRCCCWITRWRVDVQGAEHVPATGGAILTWNHTSHMDFAITAMTLLTSTGRWARLLALRELWHSKALGFVPRFGHCVPVDRQSTDGRHDALRDAVAALEEGDLVMLAPEGTISESFELLPFRAGAVRMARATGLPIIPTVSWGTHRFVTTGYNPSVRRSWRLPVTVRYGAPFYVAQDADVAQATEALRAHVAAMLDDVRASYPGGAPAGAWWVPAAMGGGAPLADEVLARFTSGQALQPSRWDKDAKRAGRGEGETRAETDAGTDVDTDGVTRESA